ncbi:MAG: helix-turn-helix transcriptional regulator [Candidatus ainarchaeum sp.]|nr:helix-turn-helix transcriptional regulator [Candidatus ainarchaeum sp.]
MEEKLEAGSFTKFYALLLLSRKQRSGYELMGEIANALGKRPSSGQIYPLLAKLKKAGYVDEGTRGARDKKTYALTPKGVRAVKDLVKKAGSIVDAVLAEKLVECEHCGCMIYENAYAKKIGGKTHYFCCPSCAYAARAR